MTVAKRLGFLKYSKICKSHSKNHRHGRGRAHQFHKKQYIRSLRRDGKQHKEEDDFE